MKLLSPLTKTIALLGIVIALAATVSLSQPVPDHTPTPLSTNQLEKIFPLSK